MVRPYSETVDDPPTDNLTGNILVFGCSFVKYWDANSIKIPHINVRLYKESKNPFKMSHGRLIILLFEYPLFDDFCGYVGSESCHICLHTMLHEIC